MLFSPTLSYAMFTCFATIEMADALLSSAILFLRDVSSRHTLYVLFSRRDVAHARRHAQR